MKIKENESVKTLKEAVLFWQAQSQNWEAQAKRNRDEIAVLKEQLAWLKRQIFGKRSERLVPNLNERQLEFEGLKCRETEEEKPQTIAAHPRRKPRRNGQDKISLSPDLPVETIILDLPEEKKEFLTCENRRGSDS